jgi:hypothetical protein
MNPRLPLLALCLWFSGLLLACGSGGSKGDAGNDAGMGGASAGAGGASAGAGGASAGTGGESGGGGRGGTGGGPEVRVAAADGEAQAAAAPLSTKVAPRPAVARA